MYISGCLSGVSTEDAGSPVSGAGGKRRRLTSGDKSAADQVRG